MLCLHKQNMMRLKSPATAATDGECLPTLPEDACNQGIILNSTMMFFFTIMIKFNLKITHNKKQKSDNFKQ